MKTDLAIDRSFRAGRASAGFHAGGPGLVRLVVGGRAHDLSTASVLLACRIARLLVPSRHA